MKISLKNFLSDPLKVDKKKPSFLQLLPQHVKSPTISCTIMFLHKQHLSLA